MQNAAKACADKFIAKGVIAETSRAVYVYGLEVLFSAGGFTVIALLFGWMTGYLAEVLLFLLAFMPIRSVIGGYHADTPGACLGISLITMITSIYAGQWLSPVAVYVFVAISLCLVFSLAPIIHPNHPLPQRKRLILKKQARVVGALEGAAILITLTLRPELAAMMALAFLAASLGMPLAIWRGQTEGR